MSSKEYILGADPGKHGAIALLSVDYNKNTIYKDDLILYPTKKDKAGNINVWDMLQFLTPYADSIKLCTMEQVHAFGVGKSSAQATFGFGHSAGVLFAVLSSFSYSTGVKIPILQILPHVWQSFVWKPEHIVWEQGSTGGSYQRRKKNTKATSSNAAHSVFPGVSFVPSKKATKEHDGCVDAALIAYCGLLYYKKIISLD